MLQAADPEDKAPSSLSTWDVGSRLHSVGLIGLTVSDPTVIIQGIRPTGLKTYIHPKPRKGTLLTPFPSHSKLEVTKMLFYYAPISWHAAQ